MNRPGRSDRSAAARLAVVVLVVAALVVGGSILLVKAVRSAGPARPIATGTAPTPSPLRPSASSGPFSPLTGTIAFLAPNGNLYLLDPATGETQKVMRDVGCCSLAWSPDGTAVAFTTGRGEGKGDVVVSHLDGTSTIVASLNSGGPPDPCCPQDVAWSQDGLQIVFTSGDGEVFTVAVNGSHLTQITDHTQDGCGDRRVSWSSSNGLIVTQRICPGAENSGIYTFTPLGSEVRKVLATKGEPQGISVSPDGGRIAFAIRLEGIFVVDADGSGLARLTHGWDSSPTWSPDGTVIAFSHAARGEAYELWAVPSAGGEAFQVADLSTEPVAVAWRPVP